MSHVCSLWFWCLELGQRALGLGALKPEQKSEEKAFDSCLWPLYSNPHQDTSHASYSLVGILQLALFFWWLESRFPFHSPKQSAMVTVGISQSLPTLSGTFGWWGHTYTSRQSWMADLVLEWGKGQCVKICNRWMKTGALLRYSFTNGRAILMSVSKATNSPLSWHPLKHIQQINKKLIFCKVWVKCLEIYLNTRYNFQKLI